MPDETVGDETVALRTLCHDMWGALNNVGMALSLCEAMAGAQPEMTASVKIALRGHEDSKRLFEQIVKSCRIEEERS